MWNKIGNIPPRHRVRGHTLLYFAARGSFGVACSHEMRAIPQFHHKSSERVVLCGGILLAMFGFANFSSSLPAGCVASFVFDHAQVALFSATMPLDVLEVTNRFMPEPVRILVKKDELTLEGE